MIDDATRKQLMVECGFKPEAVKQNATQIVAFDHVLKLTHAIEQLARAEQREADARICDREISACSAWWDNAIEEAERIANIIRAAGKENSNE